MNKQETERYLVLYYYPSNECPLWHAQFYKSEAEARNDAAKYSRGGEKMVVKIINLIEHEDESYPEDGG